MTSAGGVPEILRCEDAVRISQAFHFVCGCNTVVGCGHPFDIERLDDEDPFEIDDQAAHLFKHPHLGIDEGCVLVVPLAPPNSADPTKCRPIGCYEAAAHLADRYREDR